MGKKEPIDHIYVLVIVLFLSSMATTFWTSQSAVEDILSFSARQNAKVLNDALASFREIYTRDVVEKIRGSQFKVTHEFRQDRRAVPLPASMTIELGDRIGKLGTGSSVQLYSPFPFPWRKGKGGLKDDFRRSAWEALAKNPKNDFYRVEKLGGETVLRYARADLMKPACIHCHNHHPDSPFRKWKAGDVRGVLEIIQPLDPIIATGRDELRGWTKWQLFSGLVGISGIFLLGFIYRRRMLEQKELQAHLEWRNDELMQFAYRSSHDLKSPLIASKRLSEMISEDIDEGELDEAKANAAKIGKRLSNLEGLVSDIYALTKSDFQKEKDASFDLNEVIEEIETRLSQLFTDSQCSFKVNIGFVGSVNGQKARISQVIENLVSNGAKYRNPERSECFVALDVFIDSGNLVIVVEDNGLGIPDKYCDRIFEVFTRFHPKASFGSGLGMTLVKKHVTHMNGEIDFTSSEEGTRFEVRIPL